MPPALDRPTARVDKPSERMGQMDHFFYSALNGAEDGMAKLLHSRAKVPDITKEDSSGAYLDIAKANKVDKVMASFMAASALEPRPDDAARRIGVEQADKILDRVIKGPENQQAQLPPWHPQRDYSKAA